MTRTIAITGITGLVGSYLENYFIKKGWKVIAVRRKHFQLSDSDFAAHIDGCDFIIHLAGESVMKRWSPANKKQILESRVNTTLKIARCIPLMNKKPQKVINGSAIGIYDYVHSHTEESQKFGKTFLTEVVKRWEQAADEITASGVKLCKCRIGVVMSTEGGALKTMLTSVEKRIAVQAGNGSQAMAFVHIHDLARAFHFLIKHDALIGVFNIVAPENTNQKTFIHILKKVYKNAFIIRLPKMFFHFLMGESASLITKGERVLPQRLKTEGFEFTFPNIENTIFYLLG